MLRLGSLSAVPGAAQAGVSWPRPGTILNTPLRGLTALVLLSSSLTMALGLNAIQQGKQGELKRYLLIRYCLVRRFSASRATTTSTFCA